MLFICIICCLYSFVCLCTWLSLFVNCNLIFVFVVNTTGLILLVLNIIMYLTRNYLVWFQSFITLLLVLLLTCSISHFIVIVDSWNANKIQYNTTLVIGQSKTTVNLYCLYTIKINTRYELYMRSEVLTVISYTLAKCSSVWYTT